MKRFLTSFCAAVVGLSLILGGCAMTYPSKAETGHGEASTPAAVAAKALEIADQAKSIPDAPGLAVSPAKLAEQMEGVASAVSSLPAAPTDSATAARIEGYAKWVSWGVSILATLVKVAGMARAGS